MIIVCHTQFYQMHINFSFERVIINCYQLTGFEPVHITDLSPDHRATPASDPVTTE